MIQDASICLPNADESKRKEEEGVES